MRTIRCLNCGRMGTVYGKMPDKCPHCGNPFKDFTENSITDVLYNLIVRKKRERGFVECDIHGWVTGDKLPFPYER